MKHFLLLFFSLLTILPGCGSRFTDWAADHVKHGKVREVPKERVVKHLRSVRIYNEFSTVGIFDALWLSQDVRQAYIDVHTAKYALDKEKNEAIARRQNIERDNFISFYVLSYMPDTTVSLGDKNSPWEVDLKINNTLYAAKVIESAELSPEYTMFLSRVITKHKNIYLVKFSAKDADGNQLVNSQTRKIELRFSTVDRSTALVWYLDEHQKLMHKHKE